MQGVSSQITLYNIEYYATIRRHDFSFLHYPRLPLNHLSRSNACYILLIIAHPTHIHIFPILSLWHPCIKTATFISFPYQKYKHAWTAVCVCV